jgi:SNF2 family DNA or RNA helicase
MILADYKLSTCGFRFYHNEQIVESITNEQYWGNLPGHHLEIRSLISNNISTFNKGVLEIPTHIIYASLSDIRTPLEEDDDKLLSKDLLAFLEIPKVMNGRLELKSRFSFSSKQFEIQSKYFPDPNHDHYLTDHTSPLIQLSDGSSRLMGLEEVLALQLINDHFSTLPHSQEENFTLGGKLRELSKYGNIELNEGRLARDDIEIVDNIRPVFSQSPDGGVDLSLDIDSGNANELEQAVSESTDYQNTFSVVKDDPLERKRFILSDDAKEAIQTYKRKNHFTREEKRELLNNPSESLPGFDLSDYGDRVIGFGLLYAPTVSPIEGDDRQKWAIDLTSIEPETVGEEKSTPSIDPIQIPIDEHNAEHLLTLVKEAKAKGEDSFIYEGKEILITEPLLKGIKAELPMQQAMALLIESNIDEIKYSELADDLLKHEIPIEYEVDIPASFKKTEILHNYQYNGIGWFDWISSKSSPGCLLADDMGMGKTWQVAAFLAKRAESMNLTPTLLVLPPILIDNWKEELEEVFPTASFFHAKGKIDESDLDTIRNTDITAITYQTQLKSQQQLGKIEFKNIICDEAQHIKNPAAARTQAALAMQGQFKIALTATPIENTISELWSILDFSVPGYLPPLREFNKKYGGKSESDDDYSENISELSTILEPIVLRRLKETFLRDELPKKHEHYEECYIDELQIRLQNKIQSTYQEGETIQKFFKYFRDIVMALTNPELLNNEYGILFPTDYESPKQKKVFDLLETAKSCNEKCLIFADRHIVQEKLKLVIENKYGITVNIINSKTPKVKRDLFTKAFGKNATKEEFEVLILSPRCAGFGLNLVGANHVIHYLRNFNPAVENQATDRVYRIGQNKPVSVYYLIGCMKDTDDSTVEQKLHNLIERKRHLLKNYLTASSAGKIKVRDLANSMGTELSGVIIDEVDLLKPLPFESFTAELFTEMGYSTQLTPINDFGADVVAIGHASEPNALIQCKKKEDYSKGTISNTAVQEVISARATYEKEHQIEFNRLILITNGYPSKPARIQAKTSDVEIIDRNALISLLQQYPIELQLD